MKFRHLLLTALTAAAALFASCTPNEEIIKKLDGIQLGTTYITIAKGETSATTTMNISDSWTSEVPAWLSLAPASGNAGEYTLTFTAKADTLDKGQVLIKFGGKTQTITVTRDGGKPKKAGVIFEEPFVGSGQGDFEIKDITGSPWSYDAKYGMKATAYINNANTDAESYLISPEIDLTEETVALLTFDQAVNYMNGNPVEDYLSVEVTADNGANWEKVSVPAWPAGSGWDFVPSGDVDLAKFIGKKIKFAFHYTSNPAASPTWEIQNVKVANVAGAVPPELKLDNTTVNLGAAENLFATVTATTNGTLAVTGPFSDADCKTNLAESWLTVTTDGNQVTVTASANEGDARTAYVKFSSTNEFGTSEAVATIVQAANAGAKGASIDNPLSASEAYDICTDKTYSTEKVYVKGIISKIENVDLGYGNATFWISDDGTETKQIEAFRNVWFNGVKYESQDLIKVGDEVIIYGALTLYEKSGQDPVQEFTSGNRIVSLNGGTEWYTVAEALAVLTDGTAIPEGKVFVTGIISSISSIDTGSYGNATYSISDDGTTAAELIVYRGYYLEGKKFTSDDKISVGDKVVVLGKITNYTHTSGDVDREFTSGNYIYSHSPWFPEIEHDGDAVYFVDAAGWGAMALYLWGDENDLNGGWPGMQPTGQFEHLGYQWYYFDLGAANAGKEEHLIVNNNGGGTQIDDVVIYHLTTDTVLYFIVNPGKTVTYAESPEKVVEILSQLSSSE